MLRPRTRTRYQPGYSGSFPEAHRASLSLPSVQAAIAKGRPLIAGMETVAETRPLGGHGLG